MQAYVLLRARVFMCTAMLRKGHGVYAARIASKHIRIFVFVFRLFRRPEASTFSCSLEAVWFLRFLTFGPRSPSQGGREGRFYI